MNIVIFFFTMYSFTYTLGFVPDQVKGEGTRNTQKERKGGTGNGESKNEDPKKRGCVIIPSFAC